MELESILANQEALDKQMSKVSIKEEDKALFAKKRVSKEEMTAAKFNSEGETSSRGQPSWQRGRRGRG